MGRRGHKHEREVGAPMAEATRMAFRSLAPVTCYQPAKRNSDQAGEMKAVTRGRTIEINIPRHMETCWATRTGLLLQQLVWAYSASHRGQSCQP